jgi:hypothetical protein
MDLSFNIVRYNSKLFYNVFDNDNHGFNKKLKILLIGYQ